MIIGHDPSKQIDAVFINSPLKDYDKAPRRNDFTLPVLGLAYIATYAKTAGFNVGVLDAEANALGISAIATIVNSHAPRWIGLNLLAPTYKNSVEILRSMSPESQIMLGGHQAKAMQKEILLDTSIPRIDALIVGEGEYRVNELLEDANSRKHLPNVFWRTNSGELEAGINDRPRTAGDYLAPDINALPFVDRNFLVQDPFLASDGRIEANLVGSRGCPYDCSFCGAAKSANPDVSIRTRDPNNILQEMNALARIDSVSAFRFVDDLFLAQPQFMKRCLPAFIKESVGDKWCWDATGRVNILSGADDRMLALIKDAGCREIALGVESGSERMLKYIDKHTNPPMIASAITKLTKRGISVKGYFILGFPTETVTDFRATIDLIHRLWAETENDPGAFRCSVFEFRPYPGTPEWFRLMQTGRYSPQQLLNYEHVDLTGDGKNNILLDRDEFNFSVGLQFGEVPVDVVRGEVASLMEQQKQRLAQLVV